jgi:N-acetylglucosaminyl-diphospho-decaprenol L-rhamnosyltransferase
VTELSVVLVNYNGADCLPGALHALARNTDIADVECIVVDSASTDDSWRDVEGHWVRARSLRFDENIGFCRGCNRGAEAGDGRLVAFVNFDGEVEPGWDTPLRDLLADPSVSIATGLLVDADGDVIEAAGLGIAPNMATYGLGEGEPRSSAPDGPVDLAAASGALMMMRRNEFLGLGGFYEPIWMYGEEADLCLRVPGRVVLHPASALRHVHGAAAGPPRSRTRLYWGSRNRLVNAARHLPAPALARAVVFSAAFDALTLGQLRRRGALGAVLAGWRDGVRRLASERRSRSREERRAAARRVSSLRAAVAQQRRLGRL